MSTYHKIKDTDGSKAMNGVLSLVFMGGRRRTKDIIHSDPVGKSKSQVSSSIGAGRIGSAFTNSLYFGIITVKRQHSNKKKNN